MAQRRAYRLPDWRAPRLSRSLQRDAALLERCLRGRAAPDRDTEDGRCGDGPEGPRVGRPSPVVPEDEELPGADRPRRGLRLGRRRLVLEDVRLVEFRAIHPDGAVPGPRALAHVVANAALIAEVEDAIEDRLGHMPDQFRLARIRRERQQATRRLEADRDVAAWKATMERLDREEAEAQATGPASLTMQGVAESLADLQTLYADAEPVTKHRIVQALFEQVEVLGPSEVWLYPSVEAEARGWAAAMSGEFRVESTNGRGERT